MLAMSKRTDRRREIARLLALRESQGLSLRDLSDISGIPTGTLSWWAHHLRQEQPTQSFAAVLIDDDVSASAVAIPSSTPDIVMRHPDGVTVELHGAAAERVVDRVLATLDRWS